MSSSIEDRPRRNSEPAEQPREGVLQLTLAGVRADLAKSVDRQQQAPHAATSPSGTGSTAGNTTLHTAMSHETTSELDFAHLSLPQLQQALVHTQEELGSNLDAAHTQSLNIAQTWLHTKRWLDDAHGPVEELENSLNGVSHAVATIHRELTGGREETTTRSTPAVPASTPSITPGDERDHGSGSDDGDLK